MISGKITDLTGQALSSNRSVTFELQNCGNNLPRVTGSAVIVPANKTVVPNAAAVLAGTIVGNDVIECGTTIGQTYYKVSIYAGTQKVYEKTYYISGATWNIATAIPLSNDPTAMLNFSGYLLGDLIYGAGTNTLGLVRGNTANTVKFLAQRGDGVHSGMPYWSDIAVSYIPVTTLSTAASPNEQLEFIVGGSTVAALRNVSSPPYPEGARDFRILGAALHPGIFSIIASNGTDYADYTYNGTEADVDVSTGNLNLRPLAAAGAVNVWSPAGDTKLRVGNQNFAHTLSLYHDGANAFLETDLGSLIVKSGAEVKGNLLVSNGGVITGNGSGLTNLPWSSLTGVPALFPQVLKGGVAVGTRPKINFIPGSNITINGVDNSSSGQVDLTISASGNVSVALAGDVTGTTDANTVAQVGGIAANTIASKLNAIALPGGGFSISNNLLFGTDNTYDIGASAANRPRDLYVARNILVNNLVTVTNGLKSGTAKGLLLTSAEGSNQMQLDITRNTNLSWAIQSVEQNVASRDLLLNWAGGNVGIGTSSPTAALTVAGAKYANPAKTGSAIDSNARISASGHGEILDIGVSSGTWLQARNDSNYAINYPLYLNPNGGDVSIGILSDAGTPKLLIGGAFPAITFNRTGAPAVPIIYQDGADNLVLDVPTGGGQFIMATGGSGRLNILQNGHVGIGTNGATYQLQLSTDSAGKPLTSAWTITSDVRVKTNLRPFVDGLELVRQMHPVVYELNGKGGLPQGATGISLIAQEIAPLAPYMVGTYRAKLNPSDTDDTDIYNLNASAMPWVLANAINDLEKQTLLPVFAEDVQPACSEVTRTHSRFVKDDVLGDRVESCGRATAGSYIWKTILQF